MTDTDTPQDWVRMSFKGNKVWVQKDKDNKLRIENHRVLIKYNLKQDYEYKVHPDNLKPENQAVPSRIKTKSDQPAKASDQTGKKAKNADPADIPETCIKMYTDGASSGNPGPAGIGALLIFGDKTKEISEYIGESTNNIAELTAIKVALKALKRRDLPVRIFSDSSYSIGVLTQGYKPQKNQQLVADIRNLMQGFKDLGFIKVKGHAGIKENEVADYLATSAIKKGLK